MMTLEQLAVKWSIAKTQEQEARKLRLAVEEEILKLVEAVEEGTIRPTEGLRIAFGLNRSVDADVLRGVWGSLNEQQQKAFRWKATVSLTDLRNISPDDLEQVSTLITCKPAKPSFSARE